jgi:hypothetical protein
MRDDIDPSLDPANPAVTDAAEPDDPTAAEGAGAAAEGEAEPGVADPYAAAAEPDDPSPDPHEGAVPPGYDWPTHGGYLGCLLGLVAACTLSGFLGGTWFAILATPSWVKLTITLVIALAAFIGLGRLGWVLGKRFYREYPQPVRGRTAAAPLADEAAHPGDAPRA